MAGNLIEITISSLGKDITALNDLLASLKRHSDKMEASVGELTGMWEGPAHDAFEVQFKADYMELLEMYETISQLIGCMEFAKAEYEKCEDSVESAVSAIRI